MEDELDVISVTSDTDSDEAPRLDGASSSAAGRRHQKHRDLDARLGITRKYLAELEERQDLLDEFFEYNPEEPPYIPADKPKSGKARQAAKRKRAPAAAAAPADEELAKPAKKAAGRRKKNPDDVVVPPNPAGTQRRSAASWRVDGDDGEKAAKKRKVDFLGRKLNITTARLKPDPRVRTLTSIDIGTRNMGAVRLDLDKKDATHIMWVDLSPDPKEKKPTMRGWRPLLIQYMQDNWDLFDSDVWVIEEQRPDTLENMQLEAVFFSVAAVLGITCYFMSPNGVHHFFLRHFPDLPLYQKKAKGNSYEFNKKNGCILAERLMTPGERAIYDKAYAYQKAMHTKYGHIKRFKDTKPDDIAEAFYKALYALEQIAEQALVAERMEAKNLEIPEDAGKTEMQLAGFE